jgi:hypothetical protein
VNAIVDIKNFSGDVPTVIGTPWEGGYFDGIICDGQDVFAQVVAPKALGEIGPRVWHRDTELLIPGADSFVNGLANTLAMANAGSEIAQKVLELRIAGFDDWHIGARDQLELQYRLLKPTKQDNWVGRHGDNPSSLPVGYPYSIHLPGQTSVDLFRQGGPEAFEAAWYWSSTQYSAGDAWFQVFDDGGQGVTGKGYGGFVRPVRRLKIQ